MIDNNYVVDFPICSNCNKLGHLYKLCKYPVTSYGIILVKFKNGISKNLITYQQKLNYLLNNIELLMVSRKNSLGFVEFIRGKYGLTNQEYIVKLFQMMSEEEIVQIKTLDFDQLWKNCWNSNENSNEFIKAQNKFNLFKKCDCYISIVSTKPLFKNSEWGFPKGRKKCKESPSECSIREFCEETGLKETDINIIDYVQFVEYINGTNGLKYKYIYNLAEISSDFTNDLDKNQIDQNEIGDIAFYSLSDAMKIIRPNHINKKKVINRILMHYLDKIIELE